MSSSVASTVVTAIPDGASHGQDVLGSNPFANIPLPTTQPLAYIITILMFFVVMYAAGSKQSDIPIINPQPFLSQFSTENRNKLSLETKDHIVNGLKKYGGQVFRVNTSSGDVVVLPPQFINEVRNEKDLGPQDAAQTSHADIPGFEPFADISTMLTPLVNKYINKVLGKLTKLLSDETTTALNLQFGESSEWHEFKPTTDLLPVVSRLSTRVFMGEEMCGNEEWLRVSSEYTNLVFGMIGTLFEVPGHLTRRVVHWFLPSCRELRESLNRCREVLRPVIEGRRAARAEAAARGEAPPTWDDSLEWFRREYGEIDYATKQIQMSMAAIHTTTDLLVETMLAVARHPEHVPALREEVVRVIGTEGWKKTALYNLKFMDSFIKEAQRMRPALLSTMQRQAVRDHKLSNGVVLKKGQKVICETTHMWQAEYFPDAQVFDPYRFLRMRGTDKEAVAALASTSDAHNGFGHGKYACPGRFFAANEIKILMCHLLLKYDWKLADGTRDPAPFFVGVQIMPDPSMAMVIRRRREELDLDDAAE